MEKVQKNLVIVDYQNDFVSVNGILTCGEDAVGIEANILSLVDKYKDDNIFVTYDTHYETDWNNETKTNEAQVFPMHCVYNTDGHKLYGKLAQKLAEVPHEEIYKASFATEKLVKSIIMKNDANEPIIVQFCGVATNVCVFQNVILCYNYFVQNNLNFEIIIERNSVASIDKVLEKQTLDYLQENLNVKVI